MTQLDDAKQKIIDLFKEVESQGVSIGIGSWFGGPYNIVLSTSGNTWTDFLQVTPEDWHA